MTKIPVKTRLPLEAWVAAALMSLISTLSSLVGATADSVAVPSTPPGAYASDVVKASFVGDHYTPHRGEGLSQGLSE
jgi:hypothetical protein